MSHDKNTGLYHKYAVYRRNDPTGKHMWCRYFVLDIDHDKYAIPALKAYADSCSDEYPALASDLRRIIEQPKKEHPNEKA